MVRRKKYIKIGRPSKVKPNYLNYCSRLGGLPMKCKNGKITYAWKPFVKDFENPLPIVDAGEENFIRKHIYEMRFNIPPEEESDDERRKREYKEWIERFI